MSNYNFTDHENLRFKFKDSENIQTNYSQIYQDMFILTMLDGLRNGQYLEIGASQPVHINNTFLLEKDFDWAGVSIEIDSNLVNVFNSQRKNKAVCFNALEVDYSKFIDEHFKESNSLREIDYLQIDCEPPQVSFEILQKVMEGDTIFKVITFEHESYYAGDEIKNASRDLLIRKGYLLVASDICDIPGTSFEDWWVHPAFIDKDIIKLMDPGHLNEKVARDYILNSSNVWGI